MSSNPMAGGNGDPSLSAPVFAKILCAVDGTRASFVAVGQASRIASRGSELTLLVVTAQAGGGAYRYAAVNETRAVRVLDRASAIAREHGVIASRVVDPGRPPAMIILERASEHDLLAIGAPARSWLADFFGDGIAVAALGSLSQPLLAVPARVERLELENRIVVASDGTESSARAIDLAGRLAREEGAAITLVHALHGESHVRPHGIEAQRERLAQASGQRVETLIETGTAKPLIVDAVRRSKAWLVVMGSRRLDGIQVIGSVSRRVVHDAPCSVLLVPPEDLRA